MTLIYIVPTLPTYTGASVQLYNAHPTFWGSPQKYDAKNIQNSGWPTLAPQQFL